MDAVVAMAKALSTLPHSQRRNGTLVRAAIQNTNFAGVSGRVQFDENGDLMNPHFTVLNLGPRSPVTGKFEWRNVGSVGSQAGQSIQTFKICWPVIGCGWEPPSDRNPVEWDHQVSNVQLIVGAILMGSLGVAVAMALRWWYNKKQFKKEHMPLMTVVK